MNRSYKNLKVWEKATDLVLLVYKATKAFPKDEIYGLTSQLRRAAVSVPSNIAEGSERRSDQDFIRFLRMAGGSLAELETQLYIALKLHYIDEVSQMAAMQASQEVGKRINGLVSGLEGQLSSSDDWRLKTGD